MNESFKIGDLLKLTGHVQFTFLSWDMTLDFIPKVAEIGQEGGEHSESL